MGGGLGSLSAAYWITEAENARERFDITVYQMGWRLGGKAASGRNAALGQRIEEHGLHIWLGFYENGFRTIRRALDAINEIDPRPVRTYESWKQAFTPHSLVSFEEWWGGRWQHWPFLFPRNEGIGGEGGVLEPRFVLQTLLGWLQDQHEQQFGNGVGHRALRSALDELKRLEGDGAGAVDGVLGELITDVMRAYLTTIWAVCRFRLDDPATRRFFILNDLAGTMLIGIQRDGLLTKGFESADGEDWVEWLTRHGAQHVTTTSALVRTIYDLVLGFAEGDPNRPNFAAGTCVRGVLRMIFTYKGALMWKMSSGMGDTIFTPLYGILRHRGVKFRFFHKVDALRLAEAEDAIERIELTEQVQLVDPSAEYQPLVNVKGLDCWPSEPLWERIRDAEALKSDPYDPGNPYNLESWWTSWPGVGKKVLERGKDFDVVLCGIPVGALRYVAKDLADRSPAWTRMFEGDGEHTAVATAPTQGVQLWLTKTAEELGWKIPPDTKGDPSELSGLVGGYDQALNTWADMTHTVATEDWSVPKSVAYFCGPWREIDPRPFDEHDYPARERERLQRASIEWLDRNAAHLWPKGASPERPKGLDPELLVDPSGGTGDERFAAQWFRPNIDPNERYVLSVKGSTASRIDPASTGFDNLYVAGDWTWNGVLNAGCVEATVASGMHASRAIAGSPEEIVGEIEPPDQG